MSSFLKRMKERKPTQGEICINSEPRSVEMKNHEPQKKKATADAYLDDALRAAGNDARPYRKSNDFKGSLTRRYRP